MTTSRVRDLLVVPEGPPLPPGWYEAIRSTVTGNLIVQRSHRPQDTEVAEGPVDGVDVSYNGELHALDDDFALFGLGPYGELRITRVQWEQLGLPSRIKTNVVVK